MPSSESFVSLVPEIGYRFAGYVDGEGHFAIKRARKKRTGRLNYACSFVLHVRDDDRAILETFQEAIGGVGAIYDIGERIKPGMHTRPTAMWAVNNQRECLRLVDIFEEFSLWTKKARDFAIWAQAVRYWNGPKPEGWGPMARWMEQIVAVRQYEPVELPLEAWVPAPTLFDEEEI